MRLPTGSPENDQGYPSRAACALHMAYDLAQYLNKPVTSVEHVRMLKVWLGKLSHPQFVAAHEYAFSVALSSGSWG